MKTKMIAAVLVFAFSSCTWAIAQDKSSAENKQVGTTKAEQKSETVFFTCPMHPEVKSDRAGSCPKCKMDLVKTDSAKGKGKKEHKMKMGCGMMHDMNDMDKPEPSNADSSKSK